MGDMADMLIDSLWEHDQDMDDEPNPPALKTCRCCGETGFEWGLNEGKWRLFKRGKMHACKARPLPAQVRPRVVSDPIEKAFRMGFDLGRDSANADAFPEVGLSLGGISIDVAWKRYVQTLPRCDDGPSIGEGVADGV